MKKFRSWILYNRDLSLHRDIAIVDMYTTSIWNMCIFELSDSLFKNV